MGNSFGRKLKQSAVGILAVVILTLIALGILLSFLYLVTNR